MKPSPRMAMSAVATLSLALTMLVGTQEPAAAVDTTPRVMATTQRMTGPHLTNYYQHGTYAAGTSVTLYCHERGQSVTGYYSRWIPGGYDNLWYQTTDGHWIADVDINTGSNNPVVGSCLKTVDTNQWYEVVAKNSGKAVDVAGGSTANGARLQQYSRNSTASQRFRFVATSSGYYRVIPKTNSRQAWDISGGSRSNGAKAQVWSYGGVSQQQFRVHKVAGGGYRLTPRHVTNRCLDVPGASRNNAVQLQIWTCNTATNQTFHLHPKGAVASTPYRLPFPKGTRYEITKTPAMHAVGGYPDYNRHAVDFAMPTGAPVLASRGGSIYLSYVDKTGAIQVRINHGNNACTQYLHLSRSLVNRGQNVARGQVIGYAGSTGWSSGPHLHWNLVYCDSAKSRAVVNTLEMGTNYPRGLSKASQNG